MAKILLVEDDKSLREIYGVRLMAEGYTIVSAGDGEEALAMAIKERPDLIVSDVMMPKISGFDMLDILRSTTETKNVKVIMMTALSSEDQRARGEALGADRYLVKSQVGIEDVVRTVHDVLGDGLPGAAAAPVFPPASSAPVPEVAAAPIAPQPAPVETTIAPQPVFQPAPLPPAPIAAPVFEQPAVAPAPQPVAEAVPYVAPQPAPQPIPQPVFAQPFPQTVPAAPAQQQVPVAAPAFAMPVPTATPQAYQPAAPLAPAPQPVAVAQPLPAPEAYAPVTQAPEPAPQPAPLPPAPIAAPVFEQPAVAPAPQPMPQPIAPFSSPATLGERVIKPVSEQSPEGLNVPDLSSQIEQALNSPASTQTPGTPPVL